MSATWVEAIKTAAAIAIMLGPTVWALIVYHGDSRWIRRPEAMYPDGQARWLGKDIRDEYIKTLTTHGAMLMGQNDNIANHESRLKVLEARDVHEALRAITIKLEDVSERLARMEAIIETKFGGSSV